MPGGDLNRLIEARALDDVEAARLFFGVPANGSSDTSTSPSRTRTVAAA
jgi:hypothetical protein